MRRICPFLLLMFCLLLLMGCKLTIATFTAPETADTGTVIPLTLSCTATNISDGSSLNGVVVQIPEGWSVLYAKVNAGGVTSNLTEDPVIAGLYTPESDHVVWAGTIFSHNFGGEGSNVTFTIKVLTGDFSESIGQVRVFNLKAVVGAKRENVWITDDPENIFNFADVAGDKYEKNISVTKVEDTTAPDSINNLALSIQGSTQGTAVQVSWAGYDETAQGDVVAYRVYRSTNNFSDVSGMSPIAEVSAGQDYYTDNNTTPSNGYYYGVTAVDELGQVNPVVSTAYIYVYIPGSIGGTLYETNGQAPIAGKNVQVTAYTGFCDNPVWAGSTVVDSATADYTITGLPPGAYYLKTSSNDNYFSEWWAFPQSVRDCASAHSIEINEGQDVTGKGFQLDLGGTISGIVYDSISGTPITGKAILVTAYTGTPCDILSRADTFSDPGTGTYSIAGLPSGTYYLQTGMNDTYFREWWAFPQSVKECGGAEPVTVVEGQDAPGNNFQLDQGATISGTLFETNGETPITGKNIWVYALTGSCDNPVWAGWTNVDASTADYTITGLPPGNYYLLADSEENYYREWWALPQSVRDCGSAQEIVVDEGQTAGENNFQLDLSATISGVLFETDGETPITGKNIWVYAYTGSSCGMRSQVGLTYSNATTGTYSITGLPAGTYYLQTGSNENNISEWWALPQSVRDCGSAQEIVVDAGQTAGGNNFQLEIGATISGTLFESDEITSITGKSIQVDAVTGSPCGIWSLVGSTLSRATNGTYTIKGLPDGTYYLRTGSNENYIREWWTLPKSVRDCDSAQEISVTGGQIATGNNFQLETGATISGTVYQSDGITPLNDENLYVVAVLESPCKNSNLTYLGYSFADPITGTYTITGLPAGTCYLWAIPSSGNYFYEWWASPVSTWRYCGAQGIDVFGTENIDGKDFQLNRSGPTLKGDIDGDGSVGLADLIETLQILTGKNIQVMPGTDVNQNGKTGMEEAVYILQRITGVRP